MTTEEKFRAAVNVIRSLPKNGSYQPSHDLMLRFYGYFKQATEGPCKAARPAFWEVVRKMKWDAWNKLGNMSREEAMNNYVEELKKIVETMSYTDNVASFLGSLGSFYDSVPAEDLELLVGPIIERMRSQPGSPLSGSPFGSREASPDRVQSAPNGRSHITSSLETSPASSYSASPLPPDADEEEEEEEFIDTVEAEPERFIKDSSSMGKMSVSMGKKSAYHNGIPNGHIPTATTNGVNGVNVTNGVNGMNGVNGVNGHHDGDLMTNGNEVANGDVVSNERGRARERNSPFTKKAAVFIHETMESPPSDQRQRVVRPPFTHDISGPIGEAVLKLQHDLERITGRLNVLEAAVSARNSAVSQTRSNSNYPSWWPFSDISPQLVAFLVVWPFLAHATIALLQRRRNNRLL